MFEFEIQRFTYNDIARAKDLQTTLTYGHQSKNFSAANNAITVKSDGLHVDISDKADKVANATAGNLATLDANGNITDSGITFETDAQTTAMLNDIFGTPE